MLSVRASPSPSLPNSVFDYRFGGAIGRDEQGPTENQGRKRYLDGTLKGFDMTCAAYVNGLEHQRPGALFDAYGKDTSALPPLGFGRGSSGAVCGLQSETNCNLGSRYPPQDACWNMPPHDLSQSSQNLLNINGRGSNFQMPFVPTSASSGGERISAFSDTKLPNVDARLHGHMAVAPRTTSSTPSVDYGSVMPESSVGLRPSVYAHNSHNQSPFIPNGSVHLRGEALAPLLPGPSPSQGILLVQNPGQVVSSNHPVINAYSGLINSLLAQGLISLRNLTPPKDSIGVEFNPDLLKVRDESVISALYSDFQRQCATCGLRFKCQEEHRMHMDWHVTKNRMSKNSKKKPSRQWYVSTSLLLSAAEALVTDTVPGFIRAAETIVDNKKSGEELTVPADEDQPLCELCGEHFEDFYSHETEDWMYKNAVYLNAPEGSTEGMDRSELGPIVHPQCRPEGSQR